MAKNQVIPNPKRENSVFAIRLRYLFEEQNKTQKDLSEYLRKKGKKVFSTQMVSNWSHGSEPSFETLVIIADFFDVTTDYLLGRTNAKRNKTNAKAVFDYTGLSESAVEELRRLKNYKGDPRYPYKYACEDGRSYSNGYIQIIDVINILIGERYKVPDYGKEIEESVFAVWMEMIFLYIGEVYDSMDTKGRVSYTNINEELMANAAKWKAIESFKDTLEYIASRIANDMKGEKMQWRQLTDQSTTSTDKSRVIE